MRVDLRWQWSKVGAALIPKLIVPRQMLILDAMGQRRAIWCQRCENSVGGVMDWRETAVVPDGAGPDPAAVDAIASTLPVGQHVLLACQTTRFEWNVWVARMATVVLTNQALLVAKGRLFGHPRPDRVIPLSEITATGVGPLRGAGPTWEVTFRGQGYAMGTIYFDGPAQAQEVKRVLEAAMSGARAEAADPGLAQVNRSIALNEANRPGDAGKGLPPAQVIDESRRMHQQVTTGDLRSAWDRRLQLGSSVQFDGVPQADRFWFEAAPAIAALRLGLKDHSMVPACCGMAEQQQDRSDPEQGAAVEEIRKLFFG
jgi:hypothetical protein